jgi:general nucleoside transport system ATP-binding protein
MRGISKRFGQVQALDQVDLAVEAGTISAVVGENGAGKTTLMRALYGAMQPDAGVIHIDGKAVRFSSSAQAIAAGIGMVSQHYSIIPELTCLQNLMLGAEPGWAVRLREATDHAEELARKMGFQFDWHREAAELSPAGAQKLEILKLLWRRARIMILDEPTAMLSPADSDALFGSLRQLVDEGNTVILVTHRLPEVMDYCREVTVLRGGRLIASKPVAETNPAELAELIVGHPVRGQRSETAAAASIDQALLLVVQGLRVQGSRGEEALKGVDLQLRSGEILGIAGVDGSGQRELFHALIGTLRPLSGDIALGGESIVRQNTAQRLRLGIRLIPEDRHEEGVIEAWSLEMNALLGLQRQPEFARGGLLHYGASRGAAEAMASRFNTKHGGLHLPMKSLSGGNQQRFVAGRALYGAPQLILAFQPARGLDIDATRNVYDGMREECRRGAACLVVSFDLDEVLENCDRVAVMNHGRLFLPPPGAERDRHEIGKLMVGAA